MEGVPASAGELFAAVADDPLAREQYMDFFKNRTFRRTLLCHAEVQVLRALEDVQLERLAISSAARPSEEDREGDRETFVTPEGHTVSTSEPLVLAALRALADAWPAALWFPELLERSLSAVEEQAELAAARLRAVLLEAYVARVVDLRSTPPPVSDRAGERPCASPLARAQCAAGLPALSTLLHVNARLEDELEPRLLGLLDGTRDRQALARELSSTVQQVEEGLARFASLGLLQA
jgi:hypothetical protein